MKNLTGIIIYFSTIVKSMINPLTLHRYSLESIKSMFDEESVEVISRIYPHFFDGTLAPEHSGLYDFIYFEKIREKEIDLSSSKLKAIPIKIASKMRNVEKLNLSYNYRLKLDDEWFSYMTDNLKELTLNSCNLTTKNLQAIAKMKSLERLSLAENIKFDIKILAPILPNLKYLNVSYSSFSISDLEYIINYADKLESLDFSRNNLSNSTNLAELLSTNPKLKILNLSTCQLNYNDLQKILQIKNLEEVDLSKNYLKLLEQQLSMGEFEYQENEFELSNNGNLVCSIFSNFNNSTKDNSTKPNHEIVAKSRLKKINLNSCYLVNEKFIKSLFNIEGLEVLNLENNTLDFDMKEILTCKAKDSLKELNISNCRIESPETLQYLTDFKKLEKLDISHNTFGHFPSDFSLGQSKNSLKDLNFCYGKLNHIFFKSVTECAYLEKLDLSYSNLNGIILTELNLDHLRNTLRELNLGHTNVNHIWFGLFTDFPKLEKIDFSDNNLSLLTNEEYSLGCSKESLREIYLRNSKLNSVILSNITDCPELRILNISHNNFKEIPTNFKFGRSKESLKQLYINDTGMNSNGLQAICESKKIEILWINRSDFNDLPDNFSFGALEMSLRELIMFDSKINYACLEAISKCKKLVTLNISYNQILYTNDARVAIILEKLKKLVKISGI